MANFTAAAPPHSVGSGGEVTADSAANAVTVLSNGDLIIVGSALPPSYGGDYGLLVAEYNPNGSLNTSFSPDGSPAGTYMPSDSAFDNSSIYGVAIEPDGAIVAVGQNDPWYLQAEEFTGGTTPLSYDNNGNTLSDQTGETYTYNAWNQLVTATPNNGTYHEEYYTYNADGQRISDLDGVEQNTAVGPVLVVNDGSVQRSMIDSLSVVFPTAVTLSSGVFTLTNTTTDTTFAVTVSNPSGDGATYLLSFTGDSGLSNDSLPDGTYTLNIAKADVSGYTMA